MTSQLLLLLLTGVAAIYDIAFRRIPNWLVLAGIVAGFVWNITDGEFLKAAAGFGTGLALYLPLYLLRARGAGDVKLLAACGAIVGALNCVWLFLLAALLGGVAAIVLVLFKGRTRQTFFNVGWIMRELIHFRAPHRSNPDLDVTTDQGLRLPHGAVIAAAAIAFVLIAQTR